MPRCSTLVLAILLTAVPPAKASGIEDVKTAAANADVERLAVALASATLGPGVSVEGRTYSSGSLKLALETGALHPVVANGDRVGMFFRGRGRFSYASSDPLETANFRTNVKRGSRFEWSDGGIADTLDAALIWDPIRVDEISDGWPEGEASEDAGQALEGHRRQFAGDETVPVINLVAQVLRDRPSKPTSVVQMQTAKGDVVHTYDTLRASEERLALMRRIRDAPPSLAGVRYPRVLSLQPIDRARLERRPARYILRDVDLQLINPSGERAELEVTETFEALAPLRVIELELWNRRIGEVRHEYNLKKVALADGSELPFSHRDNDVIFELPETLRAGEQVVVRFEISGDILYRPGEDNFWWLPISPWLPVPDRLDQQSFTYHAVIKVAKPFVAFSNGETLRRWEEDELACAEFRLEKPMQFPVVLAGKYRTFFQEHDGVTVRVSSYAFWKPDAMEKIANNVHSLLGYFKKFLGDYPFEELDVIEINDYGFGIAPAGIIFITREAFESVLKARGWTQGLNRRFAHEVAHTWWGHVAKMSGPTEQWLSESTAEYYSAFAMSQLWRKSEFDEALKEWRQQSRYLEDRASVYLANQLVGEEAGRDRYGLLYAKGPLVLHALRQEMGDQKFFTLMKSYLTNYHFEHVETRNFIKMASWVAEKDYAPWFEKYLLGVEWPDEQTSGKKGGKKNEN